MAMALSTAISMPPNDSVSVPLASISLSPVIRRRTGESQAAFADTQVPWNAAGTLAAAFTEAIGTSHAQASSAMETVRRLMRALLRPRLGEAREQYRRVGS